MIGAVHEKLTSTKVNAIRKIEMMPEVWDALLSMAFVHRDGSTISKAPNSEIPNTNSRRKKNILKKALVEKALSAEAPNNDVTNSPNNMYITMMEIP